jgi:hypothetical protein
VFVGPGGIIGSVVFLCHGFTAGLTKCMYPVSFFLKKLLKAGVHIKQGWIPQVIERKWEFSGERMNVADQFLACV